MTADAAKASAGRIGGLMRAATAGRPQDITRAARDGRWQGYLDRAREAAPHVTDEADIIRRAELLRRADMVRLSQRAAKARSGRAAERTALQIPEGGTTDEH